MGRMVMLVAGALLALWVLFAFVVPMIMGLLKLALIVGVIAVIVFIAVSLVGRTAR
ncbi:hypothetical protein [Nonomuraea africana]|uniref:DUF2207 domain-containing protein n=1 Tax=Nonomuraea africana TaxID=46171 RepID=A0ABR9KR87_9ACTN|nr:hypothetical protein [Nonomuraea africana]MBE1564539.1 hypothetical protein [Nonomuraea africana]